MKKMTKVFAQAQYNEAVAFINNVAERFAVKTNNTVHGIFVEIQYNPHHGDQAVIEMLYCMAMDK